MKTKILVTLLALTVSGAAFATDKPLDAKTQEIMKKYQEAATPGPQHKTLAGMAGKWNYTSKWWEGPNAAPQESKGTSTMKVILGGRWLQHDTQGMAMGQKFAGLGLTGYDNVKGKFETLWLDTMSTGITQGSGDWDETTKTLKDTGSYSSPITTDKKQSYRGEWQHINKNKMVYSMYGASPEGGAEFKQMEMTFTRK